MSYVVIIYNFVVSNVFETDYKVPMVDMSLLCHIGLYYTEKVNDRLVRFCFSYPPTSFEPPLPPAPLMHLQLSIWQILSQFSGYL